MKIFFGVCIGVLIMFFLWALVQDFNAFKRVRNYSDRCEKAGGFTTQIQVGFMTQRYDCSVNIEGGDK